MRLLIHDMRKSTVKEGVEKFVGVSLCLLSECGQDDVR